MSKETEAPLLPNTRVGGDLAPPSQLRASGSSDAAEAHCKCCSRVRTVSEENPYEETPYAKAERRKSDREVTQALTAICIVSSP